MKRIRKPNFDPAVVLDTCTSGINDPELATRFNAARPYLLAKFHDYERCADAHNLFSFDACSWGNETQVVVADMSKKELVDLYSDQMVASSKPGRKQYDSLMMLAPLGNVLSADLVKCLHLTISYRNLAILRSPYLLLISSRLALIATQVKALPY